MAARAARPLLLLAAAALLATRASAAVALPASCPADAARACYSGVIPYPEKPVSLSVYSDIAREDADGENLTEVSIGVCFTLTFTCNSALEALFNVPELRSTVYEVVVPECAARTGNSSNATFVVNNGTFTDYGAFAQADCTALLGLFAAEEAAMTSLVDGSFKSFTVCSNADNCNAPPGSGAAPRGAAALLVVAAATAAALMLSAA